ncbi:MAG: HEAT repeat domain-containing protein [Syntrophobacterales bacterium]|nr:HEAT repeat domain-containing protein [Syntrophobacterales bacterium]
MPPHLLRERLHALLEEADFGGVVQLAAREGAVVRLLLQYLYDPEDLLHWRALEGLGHVAAAYPRQVQKVIGRLLWLLNEDSASVGWGAAAALGEIGRHNLAVVQDIIPMFCGFLEEEFSRAPMLWGVARLAEVHPEALAEVAPYVLPCLQDADPKVRALAAWCAGRLHLLSARESLTALRGDASGFRLYDQGRFRQTTVGELAREALELLTTRS